MVPDYFHQFILVQKEFLNNLARENKIEIQTSNFFKRTSEIRHTFELLTITSWNGNPSQLQAFLKINYIHVVNIIRQF